MFLFLSGELLASPLQADQPDEAGFLLRFPPLRFSLVSRHSFCVKTENSLYSNSLRPLWFITRCFLGPFQMPGFPLLPDNSSSTFIQSPFQQKDHSWDNSDSEQSRAIMQQKRKSRDDVCKEWHEAALCSQMIKK